MAGKGKRWLAIGLAVMIGCMIPVGTMKAEGDEQTVASGVQFAYQQNDLTGAFGDVVSSNVYIGMNGSHALTVSISSGEYCLLQDRSNVTQQNLIDHSDWKQIQGGQISLEGMSDGKYVACIREIQSGNTYAYAVSKSFVWDKTPPKIIDESGKEMTDGEYPADTKFTVTDLSTPVTVYMNDNTSPLAPSADGKYTVEPKAGSTSCVIKVRDKAENEKTLSLTIEGGSTTPEPEEPASNTITKPGTYSLQSGTEYKLDAGSWKVAGDSSVYPGGITFYASGTYTFQK